MRNIIGPTIKNSLIYSSGYMAVKVVGFILIPLYTDPKFFSISEFGIMGVMDISSQILFALLSFSLPASLTRWYWDKDFIKDQKKIVFTILTAQTAISLLVILVVLPWSTNISNLLFDSESWSKTIKLIMVSAGLHTINSIIVTLFKLQSNPKLFSSASILKMIVVLGLTIYFVVYKKLGVEGVYWAQLIGNGLFIISMIGFISKNIRFSFDFKLLRSMMSYGLPLLLAGISSSILTVIDRYSLNYLTVLRDVALYTLAYKLASLLRLVIVEPIKMALLPLMLKKMNAPDKDRFYSKVFIYTSYGLMFCIIGLSLFSQEIIKLVTSSQDYWKSIFLVPILSMSIFFVNLKEINIYGLAITKKTKAIGISTLLISVLNLVLNILLIPRFNTYGAAVSTLLTQFVIWLVIFKLSQKAFPIPFEIKKLLTIFIVGIILSSGLFFLYDFGLIVRIISKVLILASYPFIFIPFKFYEDVEIKAAKEIFRKWIHLKDLKKNISELRK